LSTQIHISAKQDSQPQRIKPRPQANTVRTSNDQEESNGRDLMGSVVIQCPATGRTISTGIEADRLKFACSPVFFSDAYCPMCNANHRWFARDAWVEEPEAVAEAA
jgi:hypothetical protein